MKFKRKGISRSSVLAILLIILQLISFLNIPLLMENKSGEINNEIFNKEKEIYNETSDIDEKHLRPSEILYHNQKYNLSDWWNNTFRYRIGFKLENIDSFDRYQPVDVYLTFREIEHYDGTARLLGYNNTGNNEWSEPIPIQVWNIEKYQSTNYIKSCIITFLANISANSNKTYFLYFNDDTNNIEDLQYDTDFSSILYNGKLNVSVGPSGSKYQAILEEGKGVSKLIRNNINFHSENSLTPERQLTHSSLKLLAHCDEGVGIKVNDSSGNNLEGDFIGDTSWTGGIVNNGLEFDGDGDYITFDDVLNNPFGSTSNAFTITTWIKPKGFSSLKSNHETMNCFMGKASKPYNDNLELGIYKINETHGLLNLFIGTAGFHNQSIFGDISNPILINKWNFIAVRYNEGNVDVRINDLWYTKDVNNSEPWEGANYLDQASGSHFTLGATINSEIYFNGTMDEIAIYNTALNNEEVEKCKLAFSDSSIESITELENGDVFSRYLIKWIDIYDMHIEDIVTFYSDYNLWNINRTIYFDNHFDQNKAFMLAMNSYYNFSDISDHQNCKYIYDGIVKNDITSANFIAENYTVIYCDPDPLKDTIGIFIEKYNVSNKLQSSINFLKGNVNYSNNIVQFTPGSINDFNNSEGGDDFKLFVSFWEFIDSVNQTGSLDNAGISQYFNNTYQSLKKPINIHIFYQNSLKFNLEIYVEDIDNNPVNNAIISIYNLTTEGKVDTCIATKKTGTNGKAIFQKLLNDTYTLNITYQNKGHHAVQIILKPVNITIDEEFADINDNIYYNFYNINLTILKLTLQRVDPESHDIKESVVNANISFWINDGGGDKYIGYELSDASGKLGFRWLNFTTASDGNISFSVIWHDDLLEISAEGDLNSGNNKKITLPFYKENTTIVNVSAYEFSCALVEYIPEPAKFGDELTFKVNYTYTINYTDPKPIINANICSYIEEDGVNISSMLLEFSEPGLNGTYEVKINTSNPADPELEFKANTLYSMIIRASKPGYIPKTTMILFELNIIQTNLTCNQTELEVYWNNNITLNVYFEDISNIPYKGIEGATVNYNIVELPNINGTLPSNGTDGWYKLDLNSTKFGNFGFYNMNITAYKRGYKTKSIIIILRIISRELNIKLSNKFDNNNKIQIFSGEDLAFDIILNDSLDHSAVIGANVCLTVETKDYEFTDNKNGYYSLSINSFKTIKRDLSNKLYFAEISVIRDNYTTENVQISINVRNRIIKYSLSATNLNKKQINIVQGNDVIIEINLLDSTSGNIPITGATVIMKNIDEIKSYVFKEIGNGIYKYTFSTKDYNGFTERHTLSCEIEISKQNYLYEEIEIIIVIEMEEIISGIPTFYFVNVIFAAGAVFSILIGYFYIEKKKISKIVKTMKKLKNKFQRK